MLVRGALVGFSCAIALLAACGSSKLAGPGGECFVATDCKDGLVCVEQQDKSKRCSNDLSRIAGQIPPEASVKDTGSEGGGDGGEPADTGTQEPADTGGGD